MISILVPLQTGDPDYEYICQHFNQSTIESYDLTLADLFKCESEAKFKMSPPETALTAGVTPKLPNFWPHNANAWLLQVEAQFRISRIELSQIKFDLTVQKLNEATVCCLLDLLKNSRADNLYEALKECLEQGFMKSLNQCLTDFDNLLQLGDRPPQEMLNTILTVLSGINLDMSSCPHVRFAFLKRLPMSIRAMLTSSDDLLLRELALKANAAWSTCGAMHDARDFCCLANCRQMPSRTASPSLSRLGEYHQNHNKLGVNARYCIAPSEWPGNVVCVAGKCHHRRPSQQASLICSSPVLQISDRQNNATFLVDSGAQVSIVPHQL